MLPTPSACTILSTDAAVRRPSLAASLLPLPMDPVADLRDLVQVWVRQEVCDFTVKRWRKQATEGALSLPLLSGQDAITTKLAPKPPLYRYPPGLSPSEFVHLNRCCHVASCAAAEAEYRKGYEEQRELQLEGIEDVDEKEAEMVILISEAKFLCGIYSLRRTLTDFRRTVMELFTFGDRCADQLYRHIEACHFTATAPTDHLLAVAKDMCQVSEPFVKVTRSGECLAQLDLHLDASAHPLRLLASFHFFLLSFKLDCIAELLSFSHETSASHLMVSVKDVRDQANGRFVEALQRRRKTVVSRVGQGIDITSKVNECIHEWACESCKVVRHDNRSPWPHARSSSLAAGNSFGSAATSQATTCKRSATDAGWRPNVLLDAEADDSDMDCLAAPKRRRRERQRQRQPPVTVLSITELRKKASRLMQEMDGVIEGLRRGRRAFVRFVDVTDALLKENKCTDIRYYKEFAGFGRHSRR